MKKIGLVLPLVLGFIAVGCGKIDANLAALNSDLALSPVGVPLEDGAVVHGRAIYTVENQNETAFMKFIKELTIPSSYAASGSKQINYTNVGSTNFSIDVTNFNASGFTGNILSLGSVALSTLDDNSLKVCGVNGNQKCSNAGIRVYTTGSIAGFVNTDDSYGAPVYTGSLNPNSQVGLNTSGAVLVQTVSIANNKNRLRMSDFPSPTYDVTSDFSNAGAGSYSMTYVVEYVLY